MVEITRRDFLKGLGMALVAIPTISALDLAKGAETLAYPSKEVPCYLAGRIATFVGRMGSGKTLAAVAMAYEGYQKGYTVYSNMHLTFPYKPFNIEDLGEISNSIVLLDNTYMYMDSRVPNNLALKRLTLGLMRLRVRNNCMLVTTQSVEMLDKRFRRAVTDKVLTNFNKRTEEVYLRRLNLQTGERSQLKLQGRKYFKLFDTYEHIKPFWGTMANGKKILMDGVLA